ncbi:MAG TPA: AraC family transcriptional regulator [Fimbriimonas sp.]
MSEIPRNGGAYIYALDHEEMAWTQEGSWLLLLVDHVGILSVGARTQVYQPWSAFVVPPGYRCRMKQGNETISCAFWARFTPEASGTPMVALPGYVELGDRGRFWFQRAREAMNRSYQMQRETRVVIADILWSIGVDPGQIRHSPTLQAAERFVEENLATSFRVEELAQRVGVSHNQLLRLFQTEHGVGPLEYIRHRRQNHACRLLLETSLPVKQIATEVGISDLAQFNRLVKGASGLSPRELRATIRPANLFRT